MNILQIVPRIPYPLNDGGAIGIYNITRYLHKAGHIVTCLALNTRKHYQPTSVMTDVCTCIKTVDVDTSVRFDKAFFNLFSPLPYILERFITSEFETLIQHTLKQNTFDIVHIDSTYSAFYINTVKKYTSAPVVLRAHNVEYIILERLSGNEKNALKRVYLRLMAQRMKIFEQQTFRQFDGILAITPEDAGIIRQLGYTGPMTIIPAGVDLEFFTPKPDIITQAGTIFFFGSLDWMPNIEAIHWFMQKIFHQIRRIFPSIEIHIGGKNPPKEILDYGKLSGVTIHGNVPSAPNFIQEYDIMVVPLLSGGGMRLKIVEAMAMSKAIISTSIGAEGIAIQPGKNILIADSPEEFIRTLSDCISNSTLRKNLQTEACLTAQREYSWENIIGKAAEFYQSLI